VKNGSGFHVRANIVSDKPKQDKAGFFQPIGLFFLYLLPHCSIRISVIIFNEDT